MDYENLQNQDALQSTSRRWCIGKSSWTPGIQATSTIGKQVSTLTSNKNITNHSSLFAIVEKSPTSLVVDFVEQSDEIAFVKLKRARKLAYQLPHSIHELHEYGRCAFVFPISSLAVCMSRSCAKLVSKGTPFLLNQHLEATQV